jgi:hypothetical protein
MRALATHLPSASVLPVSHKERMDACCLTTGRDVEEEALQQAAGKDFCLRWVELTITVVDGFCVW